MKKYISLLLCLCLAVSVAAPAFATGAEADVDLSAVLSSVTEVVAAEEAELPEEMEEQPIEEDVSAATEKTESSLEETAPTLKIVTSATQTDTTLEGLENITWTFEDGVLTLSGEGPIPDIPVGIAIYVPWHEYSDEATSVVIEEGITGIGSAAFQFFSKVVNVTLPDGVEYIGRRAFEGCSKLESINLPEGIVSIGETAFGYCVALESVHLPSTIEEIDSYAFYGGFDHLVKTTIADREGYEFLCWYDDDGNTYATTGEGWNVTIYPMWIHSYTGFEDVFEDDWYYYYVKYCYEVGLMNGMGDGNFDPDGGATRGQVVTVLYRMAGEPEVAGGSSFTDVYEGDWYYDAIAWAASEGIAQGMGDGTFAPNDNVTREQFLVFLYRFADYLGLILNDWADCYMLDCTDADSVSEWALDAQVWSLTMGLQTGYEEADGYSVKPQNWITRAEMATFLSRYMSNMTLYYNGEVAESLCDYMAYHVIDAFGNPEDVVEKNSSTQYWYYDDYGIAIEMRWDATESVWYEYTWWWNY